LIKKISFGGGIIRSKIIKLVGAAVLASTAIPTNLFSYATSDLSYAENVSSMIEIEETVILEDTVSDGDANISDNMLTDIADVLGIEVNEEDTYSLVLGEELAQFNIVYKTTNSNEELNNQLEESDEIMILDLEDTNVAEEEIEIESNNLDGQKSTNIEKTKMTTVEQSEALFEIDSPDENYTGTIVELTDSDRDLLERLVSGEAGGEGFEGAALVAQTIRDTMVYKGFNSVSDVRSALKYSGSIKKEPTQDAIDAVAYIFDEGGIAVKHPIFYFYNPSLCKSSWHERQLFIIEYGGHRFFSNK
jgi:hypothetical protein